MVDGVNSGYRDQLANNLMNGGAAGKTDETEKTGQTWNAVFTDKKTAVSADDFLTLMVAQLKNQDFMNPVDDTQYVTQLAQFTTMQQMQEMATYMKTNYVMSLVGKNVTAAKFTVSGSIEKETGMVQKISLVNNEYTVYVNGKQFSLEQIMELNASSASTGTEEEEGTDAAKAGYLISLIGRTVTVQQRGEDGEPTEKLTGEVEKISMTGGKYRVYIDGEWYPLDDVLGVDRQAPAEKPGDGEDGTGGTGDVTDPDKPGTDPETPGTETTDPSAGTEGGGTSGAEEPGTAGEAGQEAAAG